ncbi:MAG: dienelactone hydrolase family protein [Saccharospirillaceae bacterium]|nr:dienelactone hydrolase family protein [Saccharospirillaceae bacterium]
MKTYLLLILYLLPSFPANSGVQTTFSSEHVIKNGISDFVSSNGTWQVSAERNSVFIDNKTFIAGQTTNIEINHKDGHSVIFNDDDTVDSVVSVQMVTSPATNRNPGNSCGSNAIFRPMLLITIHGYRGDSIGLGLGNGGQAFQHDIVDKLLGRATSPGCNRFNTSYIEQWNVDWDSARPISRQRQSLSKKVNRYLRSQPYKWDIAVIGFSRGAIFTHELAALLESDFYHNLYTVLLDPTAALTYEDRYPSRKNPESNHHASLYYDGDPFIDGLGASLNTISDQLITGYDVQLKVYENATHGQFPDKWVAQSGQNSLNSYLNFLNNNAGPRSLNLNAINTSCSEGVLISNFCSKNVRIRSGNNAGIDGDIKFENGNLVVSGRLWVGPISTNNLYMIGRDGMEVTTNLVIAASSLVVNSEKAYYRGNSLIHSTYVGISHKHGALLDSRILGSGHKLSINSERIEVDIYIAGKRIDLGSIDTRDAVESLLTGGASTLSKPLRKISKLF